jgi:hypothetical protein
MVPVAVVAEVVAMPRRRLLFLALAMIAVVVAAALTIASLGPRSAITAENAAKIEKGMTLAQVEELLGGPARNEDGPFIEAWGARPPTAFWRSRHVLVCVWLDAAGTVTAWQIHEGESFVHATRRILGL